VNRAILQIANIQLIWVFLCVGGLCLRFPNTLIETAPGRAVMLGMSGFWIVRLIQQFVFLRMHHPLVHALSALFALGRFCSHCRYSAESGRQFFRQPAG
jgi:hypothetical protein